MKLGFSPEDELFRKEAADWLNGQMSGEFRDIKGVAARTVSQLMAEGFDAVFIATGAGLPVFLGTPGGNAIGVFSANEFLTRANLMRAIDFPRFATSPIRPRMPEVWMPVILPCSM